MEGTAKYLETLTRPDMTNTLEDGIKNLTKATSLITGKDVPDSEISPQDIELTNAQQAKMDSIINALGKIDSDKKQEGEIRDLATVFSTDIGPAFLDYLTTAAEQQNKDVATLVSEMVMGGSNKQIRTMAEDLHKQLKPNTSTDDFIKSLDTNKNVPIEELLSNASSIVKEMTVIKLNLPGREFGGPVKKDQAYVVGEKRAELYVPEKNGYIVPSIKNLEANMKQVKKPMQQMQGIDTSGLEATMREFATNMQSALQKSGAQDSMKEIAEQISNSMGNVTGELMKGKKVAARQLKGISGLSGNLFKGL